MSSNRSGVGSQGSGEDGAPNSRGFTLLEVLIAVAIMAGIVTVLYTTFSTSSRNVEQAEEKRDTADLARTLIARLSSDITNAFYDQTRQATFFYGKKSGIASNEPRFDNIALTTYTNWRTPNTKETDLWEVGYRFEEQPGKDTRALIRKEKRLISDDLPPLDGGTDYTLTMRVKNLRLRYFNGAQWSDDWDNRSSRSVTLPKAVEIMLTLDDGSVYSTRVEVGWQ